MPTGRLKIVGTSHRIRPNSVFGLSKTYHPVTSSRFPHFLKNTMNFYVSMILEHLRQPSSYVLATSTKASVTRSIIFARSIETIRSVNFAAHPRACQYGFIPALGCTLDLDSSIFSRFGS